VDDPQSNPTARAEACNEIAGAALSLRRAREKLSAEPDEATRHLLDYVIGWTYRALTETIEPTPEAAFNTRPD